jgi:hypothetical protein
MLLATLATRSSTRMILYNRRVEAIYTPGKSLQPFFIGTIKSDCRLSFAHSPIPRSLARHHGVVTLSCVCALCEQHRSRSGRSKQRESHRVGALAIALLLTTLALALVVDICYCTVKQYCWDLLFLCKSCSDHDGSAVGSYLPSSTGRSKETAGYLSIGCCLSSHLPTNWRRLYKIARFGSSASPTHSASTRLFLLSLQFYSCLRSFIHWLTMSDPKVSKVSKSK